MTILNVVIGVIVVIGIVVHNHFNLKNDCIGIFSKKEKEEVK